MLRRTHLPSLLRKTTGLHTKGLTSKLGLDPELTSKLGLDPELDEKCKIIEKIIEKKIYDDALFVGDLNFYHVDKLKKLKRADTKIFDNLLEPINGFKTICSHFGWHNPGVYVNGKLMMLNNLTDICHMFKELFPIKTKKGGEAEKIAGGGFVIGEEVEYREEGNYKGNYIVTNIKKHAYAITLKEDFVMASDIMKKNNLKSEVTINTIMASESQLTSVRGPPGNIAAVGNFVHSGLSDTAGFIHTTFMNFIYIGFYAFMMIVAYKFYSRTPYMIKASGANSYYTVTKDVFFNNTFVEDFEKAQKNFEYSPAITDFRSGLETLDALTTVGLASFELTLNTMSAHGEQVALVNIALFVNTFADSAISTIRLLSILRDDVPHSVKGELVIKSIQSFVKDLMIAFTASVLLSVAMSNWWAGTVLKVFAVLGMSATGNIGKLAKTGFSAMDDPVTRFREKEKKDAEENEAKEKERKVEEKRTKDQEYDRQRTELKEKQLSEANKNINDIMQSLIAERQVKTVGPNPPGGPDTNTPIVRRNTNANPPAEQGLNPGGARKQKTRRRKSRSSRRRRVSRRTK